MIAPARPKHVALAELALDLAQRVPDDLRVYRISHETYDLGVSLHLDDGDRSDRIAAFAAELGLNDYTADLYIRDGGRLSEHHHWRGRIDGAAVDLVTVTYVGEFGPEQPTTP